MTTMKNMIGKWAYPRDNSFSFTIRTKKCPNLAGIQGEMPKKVMIVSKPYKLKVPVFGIESKELYFVTVYHGGKCHVILNNFYRDEIDAALSTREEIFEEI